MSTKKTSKFAERHAPVFLGNVVYDRIFHEVRMTREATTVVEDGKTKNLEEKYEVVTMYTYDDGKKDILHVTYNSLPCFIFKDDKGAFGPKRKICARVDRHRAVYQASVKLLEVLKEKFVLHLLTADCSKVFGELKVHVVHDNRPLAVTYSNYIAAHLAQMQHVTVGKLSIPIGYVRNQIEEAISGNPETGVPSIMKTSNFLVEKPDSVPTKFIEITGYPKGPKSDSLEDKERYERAVEQGNISLTVWCNPDHTARYKKLEELPQAAWVQNKSGNGEHTSDYYIMKHIMKGKTPWISLSSTMSWRPSIGKLTAAYSIVIDEKFTQGELNDICASEFTPRSNESQDSYDREFKDGRAAAPSASPSVLQQIADGGVSHSLPHGEVDG